MTEMNFEEARHNMVEQQIRTWTVLDADVLDAIEQQPRENFVPQKHRNLAYSDLAIPLANGQEMMHPKIEAHAIQALNLTKDSHILEIGTGSGYLTALLATLGSHVDSVDIFPSFQKEAALKLKGLGISNVTMIEGDASKGWGNESQYDAIVITGSLPELPEQYRKALKIGGSLFAIVGEGSTMEAIAIHRSHGDKFEEHSILETKLPMLANSEKPESFVF